MRITLLLVFFSIRLANAQVPGNLYGMYFGWYPNGSYANGVAECDPGLATVSYVSTMTSVSIHAYGDHTLDVIHNKYYQVFGDSVNMYLLEVDISTGNTNILFTVDSVGSGQVGTVTIGGNINGTFYNCTDDQVYFAHYAAPFEDSMHLAKADHSGGITELKKFPVGYQLIDNQVMPNHQIVYMLKPNGSYIYDTLLAFDLVSETQMSIPLSIPVNPGGFWVLTYNPTDGMLWGMEEDLDSFSVNNYLADLRIINVNPVTGQVNYLTSDTLGNIVGANVCFDPVLNKMYFTAQVANPGNIKLCSYDAISNSLQFTDFIFSGFGNLPPNFNAIDIYNLPKECSAPTAIEDPKNGCDPVFISGSITFPGCSEVGDEGLQFVMFDLLGREIFSGKISNHSIHLPVQVTPDIYVYCIRNANQIIQSGKVCAGNR